ncbi:MAG: conjugal transfer protein TraF [bacterium]|nr:conjugal transfer protein TraF [bacterium]
MWRRTSLSWVMVLFSVFTAYAQPVLTPQNVALGGGGSTYITDYNANFYNPANLFIPDRIRTIDVGLAITGTYFNGVQNFSDLNEQRSNLENYLYAFQPGAYAITSADRTEILDENYIRNRTTSLHQTRLEATLLGFKIRNERRAISFAIRNRIASSFEVGRGWYSTETQPADNQTILDRTLKHRYQSLYEVSIGFAESFQFFSDMTPRLDELAIGIAPKFVIAGAYQNAVWENQFVQQNNGSVIQIQSFEYAATGTFATATDEYLNGVPAQQALTSNISDELFNPQGYGGGLDLGLTYLITLGSDFSTLENTDQRTQKSLRVSFSITDIGFVVYDQSLELGINADTSNAAAFPTNVSSNAFVGAPGQIIDFVDQFSTNNPFASASKVDGSNFVLLPTALHTGILFEVNRLKLMGDLSLGLTNNAFNSTKLVASAGVEIRPLKFLPLRAGTQLATELPNYFSFGAAIETKLWDLSIATQFVSRTFNENPTLSGITVAALQFHF